MIHQHPTNPIPTVRTKRMVIDSRAREADAYPTPAHYEVPLLEDLFGVKSVALTLADVPFPAYMVGPRRTSVPFVLSDGRALTARIAVGDYATPEDLAGELAAAMTAATSGDVTFAVSYSARKDTFTIVAPAPFTMAFSGRAADTPARVLGFDTLRDHASTPANASASHHEVVAPFRRDFGKDRYVVLRLCPNAEVLTSVSQAIDRTFAVVPATSAMNVLPGDETFVKRWSPPISRVGRLMIDFTDADGVRYDFQNQDHRLELTFELAAPPVL